MLEKLKRAIEATKQSFRAQPLDFLCENDIRALMFATLRNEFDRSRKIDEAKNVTWFSSSQNNLSINPVKTEYPSRKKGKISLFDIAVLADEQERSATVWKQPCRAAIEIKYWQVAGPDAYPWDDIRKLQAYQVERGQCPFTGIAILFIQPGAEVSAQKNLDGHEIKETNDYLLNGVSFHVVRTISEARRRI